MTFSVTCGESYSIAEEGFIFLRPVSKAEACDIHFVVSFYYIPKLKDPIQPIPSFLLMNRVLKLRNVLLDSSVTVTSR